MPQERNLKMGSSKFSDGFLLGALVGGAAVFLLATPKGNKILKVLTDEGLSGLTDIFDDWSAKKEGSAPVPNGVVSHEVAENVVIEEVVSEKPRSKRFFKKK